MDLFPGMNICVLRVAPPAKQWQLTAEVVTLNQNISHVERLFFQKGMEKMWNKSSVLKYTVGQSLYLWPGSIPTKERLCPAMSGMRSYILARLKSAWELWGLRTLNIEARCFARLPQLLQNKVVLNKRPALKHRVQSSCVPLLPLTWRNTALCALVVVQVRGRWDRCLRWDSPHQTWDVYLVDGSMPGLISTASLYNQWKEIGTFQEKFIRLILDDCFGIQ